ncbi:hypothetical protein [Luteibaculum oceani]|uniref:Uncharacterized protein n=1 Tax=Luteibaculum oceani TaxID=1294296 RepID=A0A5C6VC23_9FLAO|nr:hypothetical protein [Luteibaculum oceani]TXC82106.1 hypothetical protein FRX97_03155 [Luteibaculum oceani]
MDIDAGTILVGALSIIGCTLPFVITNKKRKAVEQKLLQKLKEAAVQFQCSINETEIVGSYAIGFDNIKKHLFFYNPSVGIEQVLTVNLQELAGCKILNVSRKINYDGENHRVIDRLELCFTPKNRKEEIRWEFYDAEKSFQMSGELISLEKWVKTINKEIKPAA